MSIDVRRVSLMFTGVSLVFALVHWCSFLLILFFNGVHWLSFGFIGVHSCSLVFIDAHWPPLVYIDVN